MDTSSSLEVILWFRCQEDNVMGCSQNRMLFPL